MTGLLKNKAALRAGQHLLTTLGETHKITGEADAVPLAWRRSGMWALSGWKNQTAHMVPFDLTSIVDGALLALKSFAENPKKLPLNGIMLLGERARLMHLHRRGVASPNGMCRILKTHSNYIALNLARADDWGLIEAWLGSPATCWADISALTATKDAQALVARGRELGLPVALSAPAAANNWAVFQKVSQQAIPPQKRPLLVDLSGLWAGPLAASLLGTMGALVVKVESLTRPDGARQGNQAFYHLMNANKHCAAFDFSDKKGCAQLKDLCAAADIVIEAARPRALRQLGIDCEKLLAAKPGKIWLSLTAYGRSHPHWVGFGDDIGVGAGLSAMMEHIWGAPFFVGDAIADPVSGIIGALSVWSKWQQGWGGLIDLSMRDCVAYAATHIAYNEDTKKRTMEWQAMAEMDDADYYPLRHSAGVVEALGQSTDEVMKSLC